MAEAETPASSQVQSLLVILATIVTRLLERKEQQGNGVDRVS
jgi:hypothetical protein